MPVGHLSLAMLGVLLLTQSHIGPPGPPDTSGADSAASASAMIKMNTIIIDKVNFDKLDIAAVLDFLRLKSKQLDPEHVGVQFRLALPPGPDTKPPKFQRAVSITLVDVPLADLTGYVIAQTNLSYRFVQGVVVLTPAEPVSDSNPNSPR